MFYFRKTPHTQSFAKIKPSGKFTVYVSMAVSVILMLCIQSGCLTLCIQETHRRVLLQTVKTQMKYNIMHSSGSTLFVMVKKIFRQKNTIFFGIFNLTPLDMYNGLSQVYCIKPEGGIH